MSKYLFLDVDGVLNTRSSRREILHALDDDKIELIRYIISQTNALIILSSDWRGSSELFALISSKLSIHDKTIWDPHWNIRCDEIKAYLRDYPAINYAIIDDSIWADTRDGHFFLTHDRTGITAEIADKIISHLNM